MLGMLAVDVAVRVPGRSQCAIVMRNGLDDIATHTARNGAIMSRTYMPRQKADQVEWANTFASVVNVNPVLWGLSVLQSTDFVALNASLQSAWTISEEPSTRTRVTLEFRDNLLDAMKTTARRLVSIIQVTPSVSSDMLIAAGLTVRDVHRAPAPPPKTAPVIRNLVVDGHTVSFSMVDVERQTGRAKPKNILGASVFSSVNEVPEVDVQDWTFEGNWTNPSRITLHFDPTLSPGTKVWVTAFWFCSRAVSGPMATPVSTQIQFGGLSNGNLVSRNHGRRKAA